MGIWTESAKLRFRGALSDQKSDLHQPYSKTHVFLAFVTAFAVAFTLILAVLIDNVFVCAFYSEADCGCFFGRTREERIGPITWSVYEHALP